MLIIQAIGILVILGIQIFLQVRAYDLGEGILILFFAIVAQILWSSIFITLTS